MTAQRYGVSKSWVHELVRRYRDGAAEALVPRSKAPHTNPRVRLTSPIDIPRSDVFVIIPITQFRTGEQWLSLFDRVGVSTETAT